MQKLGYILLLFMLLSCAADSRDSVPSTMTPTAFAVPVSADFANTSDVDHVLPSTGLFYPERPLYPVHGATIHQTKLESETIRITTFTSPDSPEHILSWYDTELTSQEWVEDDFFVATPAKKAYVFTARGPANPAFGIELEATSDNGITTVIVTQTLSGPFSPESWPED